MKMEILDYVICPSCLPEENPLTPRDCERSGGEIREGFLRCNRCENIYPIRTGVAFLAPGSGMTSTSPNSTSNFRNSIYETSDSLSAYLWNHYADLFEDLEPIRAYSRWAALISSGNGTALDAGCAVGRFCFELSCKCDFAIGMDLSENFIYTARRIMLDRGLRFQLKEEGRIHSERAFFLPDKWDSRKVEFVVADATALPFRSGSFACVASLNLLDKIDRPLQHLFETARLARRNKAQLIISDPYSWSETICNPDMWLGGTPDGKFTGFGSDNIAGLLSGKIDTACFDADGSSKQGRLAAMDHEITRLRNWELAESGAVWWKIRNHRNHYELIRSLFVKATR